MPQITGDSAVVKARRIKAPDWPIFTAPRASRDERSMAEGALESGRKDIARLMREVAALQYRPVWATAGEVPPARPDHLLSAA